MPETTYRARRFDEALDRVKRALGPDAVILSTRQIQGSALLGGPAQVEVRAVSRSEAIELGLEPGDAAAETGQLERRLERTGVPAAAARLLAQHIRRKLGKEPATLSAARPALEDALAEAMLFAGPVAGGAARSVALVGPTGVGKTTTLAKIAARAALVEKRTVGLITLDDYRVGGVEQLGRYADLIGIPMEVASDLTTLRAALRRLSRAELVLIDTAGRSPRDAHAVARLAEALLHAGEPVETHLCFAAGTRDLELRSTLSHHQALHPLRLLATKLDEAVYHGAIVAAQVLAGLPLSYFTTGQRVPEDIEVAAAGRLAALLGGDEVDS